MTKRDWIQAILDGDKGVPVAQNWMGYFNSNTARRLTPESCHYHPMWWYDVTGYFDTTAMGAETLDRLIAFNDHTGRCFACLGKGANISFGHGGPGEFFVRKKETLENGFIAEFETGVLAKIQFDPHFYHSYGHPVTSMEDLNRLDLPDPGDDERYRGFAEDAAYLKSRGEYVLGSLNGFFSGLHYFFMAYEKVLMNMMVNPVMIQAMLERLGEWNLTAAKKMVAAGADCITLCDDLGSKENLLMSPETYRMLFKPWHERLCDIVHDLGATVHFHCHGANQLILDDLVECGFDFINPFDPEEGWDVEKVLQEYGDRIVVVGGFPTSFWDMPPDAQHAHMERMASLGAKYGRYIFMDSGGVPESVTRDDYDRISAFSRKVRGIDSMPGCV